MPCQSGPKLSEYPKANHKTVVQPSDMKLCIMMVSTFLR